jgi:hypothetical protein
MEWSHDLLSGAERTLLRRLCVFGGRFTLEDVESVCAPDDAPAADALDLLSSLVDKSLVVTEVVKPVACYRLHETVREFARLKLRAAGEEDGAERRCVEHFAAQCQRAWAGARYRLVEWLDWAELEIDNVRAVLLRCVTERDLARGLLLASAMGWYWITRATTEGARWLDELLPPGDGAPGAFAWAYFIRGFLAVLKADPATARRALARAVAGAPRRAVSGCSPSTDCISAPVELAAAIRCARWYGRRWRQPLSVAEPLARGVQPHGAGIYGGSGCGSNGGGAMANTSNTGGAAGSPGGAGAGGPAAMDRDGSEGDAGRILVVTGAAGRIGTFYRQHLKVQGRLGSGPGQWRLRLVDVRAPAGAGPEDEVIAGEAEGDLADLAVAERVSAGAHSVLHLAADPSPRADFYASLLDRNIKATYNVMHAAAAAGVKRVVFASSVNAILGYPDHRQVRAEDVAWPGNVYGASKAWGEAVLGAFVARSEGTLSAIAVRIGGVTPREQIAERARNAPGQRRRLSPNGWASIVVTHGDLSHLFDCCLNGAPDVSFAVVNGISRNRHLRMDLESTRRLVGYEPQDDAFAIAEAAT